MQSSLLPLEQQCVYSKCHTAANCKTGPAGMTHTKEKSVEKMSTSKMDTRYAI